MDSAPVCGLYWEKLMFYYITNEDIEQQCVKFGKYVTHIASNTSNMLNIYAVTGQTSFEDLRFITVQKP